jgi:hypothetical protein
VRNRSRAHLVCCINLITVTRKLSLQTKVTAGFRIILLLITNKSFLRLYPLEHSSGKSKDKVRIRSACIALSSAQKENIKESGIFKSCN